MKDTEHTIAAIVADVLSVPADDVTPGARLVEDLGADSLDFTKLLLEMENYFKIGIPDDRAENIMTVGGLAHLVNELREVQS